MTTRGVVAAAVVALVVPALLFASGSALAEEKPGALVVTPSAGDLDTPLDVSTVGFCKRGTTFMVSVSGKGIEGDGDDIIVGATDLRWLEPTGYPSYDVALGLTLDGFFDRADVMRPQGEYVVTFICRNRLDVVPLQTFTASLTIDKKGRYEAQGISALTLPEALEEVGIDGTPIPGTDDVEVPEAGDANASGNDEDQAAPTDPGATTGGPPTASSEPDTGPAQVQTPEIVQTAATTADPARLRNTLIVVGAVFLFGAMGAWIWMSRRDTRTQATPENAPTEDATP